MGRLTEEPFKESCCDGGAACNENNAQSCGCDPGANWVCGFHKVKNIVDNALDSIGTTSPVQHFETGATRNTDSHKYDYEGFLSPDVLFTFGAYMHEHRKQRDGSLRDSDNWQKGIPLAKYMKSLLRHTFDLWRLHRGGVVLDPDTGLPATREDLCCAILFNVQGYLSRLLKGDV